MNELCSIVTKQTGFDYSETIKPSLITKPSKTSYPFIQNKDFDGVNINLNTDFFIPIEIAKRFPKITLDKPSILISISGKIGNIGFYNNDNKAFIGGAVGICKLDNMINGLPIIYQLQTISGQNYFHSLVKASSHANITVEDIRNIKILLPKKRKEKELVSNFALNIDKLITLHQ